MDKKFWTMFSLLALTSLCLIYISFHIHHLNYINDAQLGYAGAIIGGFMTLIGCGEQLIIKRNKKKGIRINLPTYFILQYRPT